MLLPKYVQFVCLRFNSEISLHTRFTYFHFFSPQVIGYYVACGVFQEKLPVVCILTESFLDLILFPYYSHDDENDPLVNAVRVRLPAVDHHSPLYPTLIVLLCHLLARGQKMAYAGEREREMKKKRLAEYVYLSEIDKYRREAARALEKAERLSEKAERLSEILKSHGLGHLLT